MRLADEWHDDVQDPHAVIAVLRSHARNGGDILTFRQRPPDMQARHSFVQERESLALLEVTSFDDWMKHQIKGRTRNLVRRALNRLDIRIETFDDPFIAGMTRIFNETPVRQGRRFWHYGKDFDTVKEQFARNIHRETMVGAYFGDEMVAFMMFSDAGWCGLPGQILSSIHHRDKAPANALIAKAVELCAMKGLPYLVYFNWSEDGLGEFKRRCGFHRIEVPRYYVPLSRKGEIAMRFGLHLGFRRFCPLPIQDFLKSARAQLYATRYGRA